MAIVSFWSELDKETSQTLSMVAIATYMSIEHNYKTLIIDATMKDDTLNRCFWKDRSSDKDIKSILNKGKLDIASGTEGLLSAVASNKTSPEIITNYTKVVFKNRLDILLGLETSDYDEHERSLKLYKDFLGAANKFYDLIMVDLPKTSARDSVKEILKMSDVVMYTMNQNLKQIKYYTDNKKNIQKISGKDTIPLLGSVNPNCKYNPKNVANFIGNKNLASIYYNNSYLESACEASIADFFLRIIRTNSKILDKNSLFFASVDKTSKKIMSKFEEIKYGKTLSEMGM